MAKKKTEEEKAAKSFKVVGWKAETKKRGEYEEKVSVDLSFEELIKLSVTDVDKIDKPKPN